MLENKIRKLRQRRGWTQAYLGGLVGVKQATISRLESDANHSSWGLIAKILIVLSINFEDLKFFTQNYILEENETDIFLKIIMSHQSIKTHLLYNPVHFARCIVKAIEEGKIKLQK